jgi:integron integrase
MPPGAPRLLDQVRSRIRFKHYSIRTEEAYVDWIRRYIRFHGNRHPVDLSASDVEAFLTHLAADRGVAASTQNQAQSALLFLYREALAIELPWLDGVVRAKTPSRLPVVLTRTETGALLVALCGTHRLVGELLYGTGMRILEGLRLRVKDVDFGRREILIRNGKGAKDRVTMLPDRLRVRLRDQVASARRLHEMDVRSGFGAVSMPVALARKYPSAAREWCWQYVFPADRRSMDPRTNITRRHHISDQSFQRAMRDARSASRVGNRQARDASYASTFVRHAFARGRERHPHRAGAPGALGREHDDDLHARVESRRAGGQESGGWVVTDSVRAAAIHLATDIGLCRTFPLHKVGAAM